MCIRDRSCNCQRYALGGICVSVQLHILDEPRVLIWRTLLQQQQQQLLHRSLACNEAHSSDVFMGGINPHVWSVAYISDYCELLTVSSCFM